LLRRRKLRHVIPERKDQREARQAKGYRGGRPPRYEPAAYRLRNWAERGVNRLKQWRAVATRYEKLAASYLATVQFAAVMTWLQA
jgi:transposase